MDFSVSRVAFSVLFPGKIPKKYSFLDIRPKNFSWYSQNCPFSFLSRRIVDAIILWKCPKKFSSVQIVSKKIELPSPKLNFICSQNIGGKQVGTESRKSRSF